MSEWSNNPANNENKKNSPTKEPIQKRGTIKLMPNTSVIINIPVSKKNPIPWIILPISNPKKILKLPSAMTIKLKIPSTLIMYQKLFFVYNP